MGPLPISDELVRHAAVREGVCVRPVLRRVTGRFTGDSVVTALDCESTLDSKCPPCAARARRLRMTQCTEGWHLSVEPKRSERSHQDDELGEDSAAEFDDSPTTEDEETGTGQRRTRSTRRLEGMPDLPQRPREDRTIGTVFTAPDGKRFQPSMFVTLTLDSYGKVRRGRGVPVRPDRYDYRRAALDALHFREADGPLVPEPAPLRRPDLGTCWDIARRHGMTATITACPPCGAYGRGSAPAREVAPPIAATWVV